MGGVWAAREVPETGVQAWRQAVRPGLGKTLPLIRSCQFAASEASDCAATPTPDPMPRAARYVPRRQPPRAICVMRMLPRPCKHTHTCCCVLRACWVRSDPAWPFDAAPMLARRSPRAGGALSGKYLPYGTQPAGARLTLFPERYARFTTQRVSVCGRGGGGGGRVRGGGPVLDLNTLDTGVCNSVYQVSSPSELHLVQMHRARPSGAARAGTAQREGLRK